ncbi:MAG: ABC transporter substrate-binding protein [Pseudolabrys sp.]|nr:ABC transporter substrate-binding protein [Pseudolabrys sp.]MSP31881.1 ABC transporter substrate-binding protein [Pseudolabrys sp.]
MPVTITSIAGGAPKPVFDRLGPLFEKKTGNRLNALYDTMSGIQGRLAKHDALDVLLMPVSMLDGLEKDGTILPNGRATLAIIGLGVGVKAGSRLPDISTPEALRTALSAARAVVHAPPTATPSGAQSDKVIKELGLAGKLAVIHKAGLAGGVAAIASGEAEYGIFPKSEIVAFDGVTLVDSLPGALQLNIVYGAGITAASSVTEAAAAFIQFLIEPESRKVWTACGFDTP